MINVIRKNFQNAKVDEHVLDSLIDSNRIIAFYRANEWVVVGKDAVRRQRMYHEGEERRKKIHGNGFCMN